MIIEKSIRAESVLRGAEHTLFVEGNEQSFDPTVLEVLFGDDHLLIQPLGASYHVKSVAEALYIPFPKYYFLIDRDHYKDKFVQTCWEEFPDPETHNLLVWKRREIENYFLDPHYLSKSEYCKVSEAELRKKVLEFSKKRLFLDVANHVIIEIREELKQNWIEKFSNPDDFSSKKEALKRLKGTDKFAKRASEVTEKVSEAEIEERFTKRLDEMTGGGSEIAFGKGCWLEMIQGKEVLSQIINSSCFEVTARDGKHSQGQKKLNAIIKDLLKQEDEVLPPDFKELRTLIHQRINHDE